MVSVHSKRREIVAEYMPIIAIVAIMVAVTVTIAWVKGRNKEKAG